MIHYPELGMYRTTKSALLCWRYMKYNSRVIDYDVSNYKKETSTQMYRHFKSDIINDMDHMRISGTEPSSVILSQRK